MEAVKTERPRGIIIERRFTKDGVNPLDQITWVRGKSVITEPDGTVVFKMDDVEVPEDWSQLATDIVAAKYFRKAGVPITGREMSARQVVHRITHSIRAYGETTGYFATASDAKTFEAELAFLLANQYGAFNSPVWFNCGLYQEYGIGGTPGNWRHDEALGKAVELEHAYKFPQSSACFIQRVEDDLMSIFGLVQKEARVFKYGSGTGTNFSKVRSKHEHLSGGGMSSGVMSFLAPLDKGAGATKSGGTTRRAAKMVILDADHPEILDFIRFKAREEWKARILIAAGLDSDFNGEAYGTVGGQNANFSVRVPDEFMKAYEKDGEWQTTFRTTGEVHKTYKARELVREIAKAAWECADPGMQFDTIINRWHTCANTDRIYASNPCSEFMFLDDTACNLASLNLMKFRRSADGTFDVEKYKDAARVFAVAMEILVDFSSYPSESIARNSHDFRPLGLGYANLGTLLMVNGIPYDSNEGRTIAAALTAVLCGEAYAVSAEIAGAIGPFAGFEKNREPMLRVIENHRDAAMKINKALCPGDLYDAAKDAWIRAHDGGVKHGYRNAQMTVLAPTGTIGLLMDCDTTGVEPDFSLVKWKKLAGGGQIKITNKSVDKALRTLGYTESQILDIIQHIKGTQDLDDGGPINFAELKKMRYESEEIEKAAASVKERGRFDEDTPFVNPITLDEFGMSEANVQEAQDRINGFDTIEGAPYLKSEHLPVFDCANKCGRTGERFIEPMAHVKMMAAVQPFISGAISKTINMPRHATVKDIEDLYVQSWRFGLKAVAIYRDGSKGSQPLNSTNDADAKEKKSSAAVAVPEMEKFAKLAAEKNSDVERLLRQLTTYDNSDLPRGKFEKNPLQAPASYFHIRILDSELGPVGAHVIVVEFPIGVPKQVFVSINHRHPAVKGASEGLGISLSRQLRAGVAPQEVLEDLIGHRDILSGLTDHPLIKSVLSLHDTIAKLISFHYQERKDFINPEHLAEHPEIVPRLLDVKTIMGALEFVAKFHRFANGSHVAPIPSPQKLAFSEHGAPAASDEYLARLGDAPLCDVCGHMTVRNGTCYRCLNCGNSMGCS